MYFQKIGPNINIWRGAKKEHRRGRGSSEANQERNAAGGASPQPGLGAGSARSCVAHAVHHKAAILRPVLAASRLASKRFAAHWLGRADEAAVQARVQGSVVDSSLSESGKHVDTAGGESELEPQCLCPNDRLHFCSLLMPTLVEKNWKELIAIVLFSVQQRGRMGNVKESSPLRSALKQTVPEKVAASFALNAHCTCAQRPSGAVTLHLPKGRVAAERLHAKLPRAHPNRTIDLRSKQDRVWV